MSRDQKTTRRRETLACGVYVLILGVFSLATLARVSKYFPEEGSKPTSFRSTKAAENRSDKIVQFEVIEAASISFTADSVELIFKEQPQPVCKIRILLHPYPFRPPPA